MRNVIYIIKNKVNNKFYIGSSINFSVRKNQHLHHLKKRTHHNPYLQNFVNKYGINKIYFEIIERCNDKNLIEREQFYIDKHKYNKVLFNVRLVAENMKGTKRTDDQKRYMVECRLKKSGYKKNYKRPKDVIDKIKKTRLSNGSYVCTKKTKQAISKANKGKKISEKTKRKISESLKDRVFTEEHKLKLSESAKGNVNWKKNNYKCKKRNKKISEKLKIVKQKKVLNTKTGFIYNSINEAAIDIGMPASTLGKHLSGFNKTNKTNLIYAK
jgi:group I intron endonuclease